jgi:hypothetical protein
MKRRRDIRIIGLILALAAPVGVAAQDTLAQNNAPKHHHYKLIALRTLGGPLALFEIKAPILAAPLRDLKGDAKLDLAEPDPASSISVQLQKPDPDSGSPQQLDSSGTEVKKVSCGSPCGHRIGICPTNCPLCMFITLQGYRCRKISSLLTDSLTEPSPLGSSACGQ